MGLDKHGLNFVWFAANQKPLERVAMLGRQEVHVSNETLRELFPSRWTKASSGLYCEDLLTTVFSATSVDSFDNSNYEGATIISDFNKPISCNTTWDTILDLGTLEHIYNVPQALLNISQICREGGQIIHVLPANNQCGHGFWQFSPELFFSLYCPENGYSNTMVFVADLLEEEFWYEVKKPTNGERANIVSNSPLYVMVRTLKAGMTNHKEVQQSDYTYAWNKADNGATQASTSHLRQSRTQWLKRQIAKKLPQTQWLKRKIVKKLPFLIYRKWGLNNQNSYLVKKNVRELLS